MDTGYSTVRNLLYVVLALVVLAILSNFYVASQLDRNSQELASLRLLLQKQLMGTALTQVDELQKRMEALNQSAAGIDAKMKQAQEEMDAKLKKAQDDFVARMNVELPRMMDNYVKQRAPLVQRQLEQRGVPIPKP
jgi:predicted transcriptional regulator